MGDPARWFAYVERGCFKYVTRGISDGRDHLTWFSFEGEFVADYPCFLSGQPSQSTIEAMLPCRVWRVSGEELLQFFHRSIKNMELRALAAEHILGQYKARYQDFHRATPSERYDQLLIRCPGIVEHLPLRSTFGRFARQRTPSPRSSARPLVALLCKERHAADALPNPQGLAASRRRKNRFRSAGITFLHPNTNPIIDFCMLPLHF